MILLVKTLAVLAVIALARSLLRGGRKGQVTPVVLAVLAAGAFSTTVVPVARDGVTVAKANHALTESDAILVGAEWTDTPFDAGFVEWMRARVSRKALYQVASPAPSSKYVLGWLSYRMLPRRPPVRGERADVLVLWGPDAVRSYDRRTFGPPELYAPGLGIARRRS